MPPTDLGNMIRWCDGEFDKPFDYEDFMKNEFAGERALFDINNQKKRVSEGFASWYWKEDDLTIEDRKSSTLLFIAS
jgi:hypothetical protein